MYGLPFRGGLYGLIHFMIKIESLSHDGRGIARIDGKTVFVTGALPGETVQIRYYKRSKKFDEAVCENILEASADRVKPLCPHFSMCGGCNLQHLNSDSQRQHKQAVLLEQLKHFGQVEPENILLPLYADPPWAYRYRARLSVRYLEKKDSIYVGFRELTHPRLITDMQTCEILVSAVGKNIQVLRDLIRSLQVKKHIPQIEIAAGDGACALIFRNMVPLPESDREKLCHFGQQHGFWIILQSGNIDNLEWLLPEKPQFLSYRLSDENLSFFFEPAHFTQVNPQINQKLIQKALALLEPQSHETILDLFCGLGNFSLPIAKYAKNVVGVEGSEKMVRQAEYNAQANQLTNTHFYAADLSHISFREMPWAQNIHGKYDKILLDPARTGALEIVHSIEQWNPEKIVYVSCNPATLARDAGILVHQKGYQLRQAGIADMFPHTSHVESIAVFERAIV